MFNFDESDLMMFEPERVEEVLRAHPAIYVNHLMMARHLDAWALRLVEQPIGDAEGRSNAEGFAEGLREVAAHLRQGDYAPGGGFYDQT